MPTLNKPPRVRLLRLCVLLGVAALGCGHPATEQECQEIVQRIATLELIKSGRANTPEAVSEQVEAAKRSLRETTLKECVGRRLTERAMRCVREAKSPQEIAEECFK